MESPPLGVAGWRLHRNPIFWSTDSVPRTEGSSRVRKNRVRAVRRVLHSQSSGRRRKKRCGPFASRLPQRCATGAASFACSFTPWYLQRCGRRITRRRAEVSRRPLNSTPARGCTPPCTPRTPAHSRNWLCSSGLQKTRTQKHRAESFRDAHGPPPPRKRLWKCLFFLDLQSPLLKHPPRYQEDYNFSVAEHCFLFFRDA